MKKLVLFDIDGTLLNAPSSANAVASHNMFKQVYGIDAHEEMIDNVGKTEMQIITEVLEKVTGKKITNVLEDAYKVWGLETKKALDKEPAQKLPGVDDILVGLKNQGMSYGLLTGGNIYRAKAKLKSVGLLEYFLDDGELRGAFVPVSC